jgi:fumarylacetoacetate (FAA) hydrolase family protein
VGDVLELLANAPADTRDPGRPWLLAPADLQVLKAAGVTFAESMVERVIEERARGDADAALELRTTIAREIGTDLASVRPGSDHAEALKRVLIEQGVWSQYLEVGIGPDAEIFTKAPVLSAVGTGADAGVLRASEWNNPEPEVVLAIGSDGSPVGATLGNDVNLRDIEGRSALLLPKAKDNNASCALGPFVRLFDDGFSLDDVRSATLDLTIDGEDGYRLTGRSDMTKISRDPADIAAQLFGAHQYPDGAMLMLGTLFAPIEDRDIPGRGFTHKPGDIVSIRSAKLGTLRNRVLASEDCAPWTFGVSALMRNLAARHLV